MRSFYDVLEVVVVQQSVSGLVVLVVVELLQLPTKQFFRHLSHDKHYKQKSSLPSFGDRRTIAA
jgi:hypothetical protein